ncbi:MAG: hypothetical protein ACOYMN_09035 [Roseimicrobium sp.]
MACGILNVWLLPAGKATPYRGGEAKIKKAPPSIAVLAMCAAIALF